MSLMPNKYYTYMVTDDGSSNQLANILTKRLKNISYGTFCASWACLIFLL